MRNAGALEEQSEQPQFQVIYTIYSVGERQLTATTPEQLDNSVEQAYEELDLSDCEVTGHDERIVALNDAAHNLLVQWGRLGGRNCANY